MQTNHTRAAGAVIAVIAAAGAGYSIRPSAQPAALASRNPAVEVRTVVVRRTVHIVRHERLRPPGRHAGAAVVAPGSAAPHPAGQPTAQPGASSAVRTSTSHHAAASAPAAAGGSSQSTPVTTRTSASGGAGAGAAKPVTTRTSGGQDHGDGGGDGGGD